MGCVMENLKIRVNNEAESKEAQELFFELGGKWKDNGKKFLKYDPSMPFFYLDGKILHKGSLTHTYQTCKGKELTIPKLCDIVAQSKSKEQGLISGKEAKLAWANGEVIEFSGVLGKQWIILGEHNPLSVFDDKDFLFRIKPKTIKLELEIPAPFEPKEGDTFYYLSDGEECGYVKCEHDWAFDPMELNFGAWRTEEEIKQVVAALRGIKK